MSLAQNLKKAIQTDYVAKKKPSRFACARADNILKTIDEKEKEDASDLCLAKAILFDKHQFSVTAKNMFGKIKTTEYPAENGLGTSYDLHQVIISTLCQHFDVQSTNSYIKELSILRLIANSLEINTKQVQEEATHLLSKSAQMCHGPASSSIIALKPETFELQALRSLITKKSMNLEMDKRVTERRHTV